MTLHTRYMLRHGAHTQPIYDGDRMAVTMLMPPWESLPTESLPKPVTVREQYGPTVKTPVVAKARVPSPDKFGAWDQDELREAWTEKCRKEGHSPREFAALQNMDWANRVAARRLYEDRKHKLLRHLAKSEDTRQNCLQFLGLYDGQFFKRLMTDCHDTGLITLRRGQRCTWLCITPAGRDYMEREV